MLHARWLEGLSRKPFREKKPLEETPNMIEQGYFLCGGRRQYRECQGRADD